MKSMQASLLSLNPTPVKPQTLNFAQTCLPAKQVVTSHAMHGRWWQGRHEIHAGLLAVILFVVAGAEGLMSCANEVSNSGHSCGV
jgi:hypothetical protein